jgi:hypothetical protein
MVRSEKNIQLDLNNPIFQESWFNLEASEAERVRASFEKIHKLSWNDFYKINGYKWEKIESIPTPQGVDALYTFRITNSVRGVAYRDGNFMRVMYIQPDHDATYGKK